ncbi:MAG: FAD-binding oxidoreductase [Chloroflexi bacterium]|nr:FAD-binding oxidoreductase [Chloroflexota bacterium]
MVELLAATLSGQEPTLSEVIIDEFKKSLRGELLSPDDLDYDEARSLWNGNVDKRPALIAICDGVADVINCVNFARNNNVLISVRGGGHSFPSTSVANDGLVIDLSNMDGIRVDPVRRTARAEGGVKWGAFDHATQAFGLATTGGTNTDTGIAGLTLGGGHGWLGGKHALALDNLISVDIVTADGQLRIASEDENPDLFWAVRGGGGNFGVVTSFEYRLQPVTTLLAGMIIYPIEKAPEVIRFYRDFTLNTPDEFTSWCVMMADPDGNRVCVIVPCYNGPIAEGEAYIKPLRELGTPIADLVGPMNYEDLQALTDAALVPGRQYYEKSHFMKEISDEAIDLMVEHFAESTAALPVILLQQVGNAVLRVANDATAYSHRDGVYNCLIIPVWDDPGETEIHRKWCRDLWEALEPYGTGGIYVNNIGREEDDSEALVRSSYGSNYLRLAEIKKQFDGDNLFRHNQNIRPAP